MTPVRTAVMGAGLTRTAAGLLVEARSRRPETAAMPWPAWGVVAPFSSTRARPLPPRG